jgi:hypothetical protein
VRAPIPEHRRMTRILNRLRRRHAAAVAYLALFVTLGGSAYAAATIRGADVFDRSLAGIDIAYNTVDGYNVKDGSITPNDLGYELEIVRRAAVSATDEDHRKEAYAECPAGTIVTGGGAMISEEHMRNRIALTSSSPGSTGWRATAAEMERPDDATLPASPWTLRVYVHCLKQPA